MLLCIGSYLLCKMMDLQVISTGSFPIENEVTEEVQGMVEVSDPQGDGMEAEALMMTLVIQGGVAEMTLVTQEGGVAEMTLVIQGGVAEVVLNLATVGPIPKEAAGMIG